MPRLKSFTWLRLCASCFAGAVVILPAAMWLKQLNDGDRDVWRAVVMALPKKISPREMSITGYYIIKQTHEPVFRKEDGYNYTSKILTNWSRSIDYKSYMFCPDTKLSFDERHPFSVEYFRQYLLKINAKFDKASVVSGQRPCLTVEFSTPARRYMDFLTAYSNAPSIQISSTVEAGLGPYVLDTITPEEITLHRRDPIRHGFNKICIYDYKGSKTKKDERLFISDYNFALTRQELGALDSRYVNFENMSLKSAVLLINVPDLSQRRIIYNCINLERMRDAFSGNTKQIIDVRTILPLGVPGGLPGKAQQACHVSKADVKNNTRVTFTNWINGSTAQFEAVSDEFFNKTGIRIKIVDYPIAQLAGRLYEKPKPYDLIIIMSAPDSDDNYSFLASYFGKNSLLDYKIPEIERLYGNLTKEDDLDKQKDIAAEIADRIDKSYALLPLYQVGTKVYYPKMIKNIMVGRELHEYPDVSDFRW